jgi:hypothetical protein
MLDKAGEKYDKFLQGPDKQPPKSTGTSQQSTRVPINQQQFDSLMQKVKSKNPKYKGNEKEITLNTPKGIMVYYVQ